MRPLRLSTALSITQSRMACTKSHAWDDTLRGLATSKMVTVPELQLPTPPFIQLEGIENLRDIGGYPVGQSKSVRRGFLYRSAHLASLTDETAAALVNKLGIKYIYDFRSNAETKRIVSREVPGTTRIHLPVFADKDASPEAIPSRFTSYTSKEPTAGFVKVYSEILTEGAKYAYRVVFEHIRDRPNEPLLFHCMGGKDRTGCFAALCLRLAGVSDDEIIVREYALTTQGLARLNTVFVAALKKTPAFIDNADGITKLLSSEPEYMRQTLRYLDETWGSVDEYLITAAKFSKEDVEKIKTNLRSDAEPLRFEFL